MQRIVDNEDRLQRIIFDLNRAYTELVDPVGQSKFAEKFEEFGSLPYTFDLSNTKKTSEMLRKSDSEAWSTIASLNDYILKHILSSDDGTPLYIPTDASGKVFAYRSIEGKLKVDVGGTQLAYHLIDSGILDIAVEKIGKVPEWLENYLQPINNFTSL